MPDSKECGLGSSVFDNKADQLEELRGKHHLLKKDFETYQQWSQEEIQNNDERILQLRQENWNLRVHLGQLKNADERVICSAFKDDREGRLQLQRNSAEGAIKDMDHKVCEGMKQLNFLKYERKKKEYQLQELGVEYDNLVGSLDNSPHKSTEESIGKLENALDKVEIKLSTAQSITTRLEEIMIQLHEDALQMPGKLDKMEQIFLDHTAEVEQFHEVNKCANSQKDDTKRELMRVEQHVHETRKKREMELSQMKKEVNRRKNEADKVEKKYQRNTLLNEGQEQKLLEEQEAITKRQHNILRYEDALQRIMDSSNVVNINDVVDHYKTQLQLRDEMKSQLQNLSKVSKNLRTERDQLSEAFEKMKYSGQTTASSGQQDLDAMNEKITKEKEDISEVSSGLEKQGQVLNDVTQSIGALLHKFDDIKLSPPEHNFKTGNVFEQLGTCMKKADKMMNQLNGKTEESNVLNSLPPEQFNRFADEQLTSDNVRIVLDKKESTMSGYSDFDYDGQEGHEQAPSRMSIKTIAQKLVAQKMGKKKKKEKN